MLFSFSLFLNFLLAGLCRYEDNGDAVNNLTVIVQKTDKTSIEGYGAPDKFLGDVSFLLGEQVFKGARSGFKSKALLYSSRGEQRIPRM